MRRSIATVSLSGMLREKMQAAAAARFDGVEIFENDLLHFAGSPGDVRKLAADLGLTIEMFQPFRDFDAATPALLARNLERAERKFELMGQLGTSLILVCSNVQPDAPSDIEVLAEQFHQLAERASNHGIRIAYEALAWGSKVKYFSQAWAVVERVGHPHLGLALDSFHTLSLKDDPGPLRQLPGDKIFFVQLADAPQSTLDVLTYSRHYRCFPGQGDMDVTGFVRAALDAGYVGPISLEIFNDEFRSAPARANASDAMRSLLWLEEQVRKGRGTDGGTERVPLFDPPAPPRLSDWAFIEFAVDPATATRLAAWLKTFGFEPIGRHRTKDVDLYGFGGVRLVLNCDEDSFARSYFDLHGASVCAQAVLSDDAARSSARAEAFGCLRVSARVGSDERAIPAIVAPDGSLLYFTGLDAAGRPDFESDFALDPAAAAGDASRARVDHIAQVLPGGEVEPWVLFYRAILGLSPARTVVLHDPYGVIRSREIESDDLAMRYSLMVSERTNTAAARSVSRFGGAGVQQIAIAVDDVIGTVSALRANGAPFLAIPDNYYDDLAAKYELEPSLLDGLRKSGVLFDRDADGDFLHAYLAPFEDRFEFEFVERRGGYRQYGSANASLRLAALTQWREANDGGGGF